MLDAENKSTGNLDSAALLFGNTGKVGITAAKTGVNNGSMELYTNGERRLSINSAGQVSINSYLNYYGFSLVAEGSSFLEKIGSKKLNVSDTFGVGNNLMRVQRVGSEGYVRIGPDMTATTQTLQVNGGISVDNGFAEFRNGTYIGLNVPDGSDALTVWSDAYIRGDVAMDGTNPTLQMKQNFSNKGFLQLSGDNVRIGTNSGNSAGNFIIRNNGGDRVTVDGSGNMDVQGDITASGNKGILTNSHGAGQLKYYTRTVSVTIALAAGAMSGEIAVGLAAGVFSSPPKVFAGDIVSTGGTSGELFRTQLVIYDVTTTSCKVRVINNSNSAINYNTVWNLICVGE